MNRAAAGAPGARAAAGASRDEPDAGGPPDEPASAGGGRAVGPHEPPGVAAPPSTPDDLVGPLAAGDPFDVSVLLARRAREAPYRRAVVVPRGRGRDGREAWAHVTFGALDDLVTRWALALERLGARPGDRVVVLIPPGIELLAAVYAAFRAGTVVVLIDPGMGLRALVRCLERTAPRGLLAAPLAHTALGLPGLGGRRLLRALAWRVRVGPGRGGLGVPRLEALGAAEPLDDAARARPPRVRAGDPAAVLFTSGSTGPAKGVLYEHGMFAAQARHLARLYGLAPGEVDVPGLPVFALFSAALGVTTVFPAIDFRRPGRLDPARFVDAIEAHGATYSFGSPAIWGPVARWCADRGVVLRSLRRVFMAGAPVPPWLHELLLDRVLPAGADTHTPFGATESLPVATARGSDLRALAQVARDGRGTCVGRPAPGIEVRIVRPVDGPIARWADAQALAPGEVGEVVVAGDVVTKAYYGLPDATARAKVVEERPGPGSAGEDAGPRTWHRMGDVGYLDGEGRLWFCGRAAHRVTTAAGPMDSALEGLFDDARAARVALVGVGPAGAQRPVLVAEPRAGLARAERGALVADLLAAAARDPRTAAIRDVLLHPGFPVDVRHNAKIRREELARWAAGRLGAGAGP